MKNALLALVLSSIASPALAWGWGNSYSPYQNNYGYGASNINLAPNPIIGPCYGNGAPIYANTYSFPGSGMSMTEFSGGINGSANTYSFPGSGMSTTVYSGY